MSITSFTFTQICWLFFRSFQDHQWRDCLQEHIGCRPTCTKVRFERRNQFTFLLMIVYHHNEVQNTSSTIFLDSVHFYLTNLSAPISGNTPSLLSKSSTPNHRRSCWCVFCMLACRIQHSPLRNLKTLVDAKTTSTRIISCTLVSPTYKLCILYCTVKL